jgi:UDP-N-acetylglucosamine 4,6-dehydratase
VIPLFVEQVMAGRPITVTDPHMTRFMMTLDNAVDLVMYAFTHGRNGDIFVQKAPAATISTLTAAILRILSVPQHEVREIGTRHGEKLFEVLLSREERANSENLKGYFRVPADGRDLNYSKFVEEGEHRITLAEEYTSHNTERLDVDGMVQLLMKLDFVQRIVGGESPSPEE